MADIASMLGAFSEVAAHPGKELDKHLAAGKRVIGVGPYHVPEELVYAAGADAVIILLAKFCDPEEFEAPLATRAIREAGLKCITVEIDQSTESYEQARTQVQTLAELIG